MPRSDSRFLTVSASRSKRRRVVEGARHETETLGQVAPHALAERRPRVLLDRVVDDLAEVLVGPVAPGEPDEREARREQAAVGQVVDRRHELLAGQVAGDPEEDQAARAGDAREPLVTRVAQGVAVLRHPRRAHASPSVGDRSVQRLG